jgi:ribosome-interacting GTPase 1
MIRYTFFLISILLMITLIAGCGGSDSAEYTVDENLPLDQQVDLLIENNEYEAALTMLEGEDRNDPEIAMMLEKIHLNYGLHSMNTFDETEMRTRMNNALTQFTEVLRINPDNAVAREQIEQIMMIYATIPDREPEPEVMDGLRELGFDY